jgi:hypothetical protein
LFRVLKPTRAGVILESLDEQRTRSVAGPQSRVSLLKEISIYTTDAEGSVPLEEVLRKIYAKYGDQPCPLTIRPMPTPWATSSAKCFLSTTATGCTPLT